MDYGAIRIWNQAQVAFQEPSPGIAQETIMMAGAQLAMAGELATGTASYLNHLILSPAAKFAQTVLERTVGTARCDGLEGETLQLSEVLLAGVPLSFKCVHWFMGPEAFWMYNGAI